MQCLGQLGVVFELGSQDDDLCPRFYFFIGRYGCGKALVIVEHQHLYVLRRLSHLTFPHLFLAHLTNLLHGNQSRRQLRDNRPSRLLKKFGCRLLKKTQRRGARKIDPSALLRTSSPPGPGIECSRGANASLHYSIIPLLQSLLRWSEAIERTLRRCSG